MDAVRPRLTCRLCDSRDLVSAFALAPTPLANAFVTAEQLREPQPRYPLELEFCRSCTHLQLRHVVDPKRVFEHYVYVSGTSPTFVRHFADYARSLRDAHGAAAGRLVIDIGSNDGTLLREFRGLGARVLGVDPARNIAAAAARSGVETLPEFFSLPLARRIRETRGPAAIVTANNVCAHIDDLGQVLDGVAALLEPDGLFSFEVSYLGSVIEKALFDLIYHEHLDYHALGPLAPFLRRHGLELIEAKRVDSHGGSIRGIAQRLGGARTAGASVDAALQEEHRLGLGRIDTYRDFAARISAVGAELGRLLRDLKAQGRRIAGFGAPAKATTLLFHLGVGADMIDFIVDDSPLKQGLFSPGLHIPVLAPSEIEARRPDFLLILAWNFAAPIVEKHAAFRERGGRFIVPLPQVRVI